MVKKYQGEKPESIKNLVMHVTYLQECVMFHENISKSSSAELLLLKPIISCNILLGTGRQELQLQ